MKTFILALILSVPGFGSESHAAEAAFKKVVTVIFENANYSDAIKQPYFAEIAKKGALFTRFIAEAHPSQANYIALTAGDTLGVRDDKIYNLTTTHIGNLLEAKGLDWRVYAENLPSPCFLEASQGRYVRKHVPFLSFTNVQSNPAECAKISSAASFQNDVSAGRLPTYTLYVPNMDNDGHDTGANYASNWLANTFGPIFNNPDLLKDTLFIITFDESSISSTQNMIYTVLLGANVIPGSTVRELTTHYSLLRTVEDTLALGTLGRRDAAASAVSGIWK